MVALPPVVEPGAELTRDEVARYSRHLIIPDIGVTGQRRLKNARILVMGAGGLGSPTLLYLAAAGVGTIGIVDFDTVDESNLQRQVIHGVADLNRPKTHSARDSIAAVNPLVNVVLHEQRLEPEGAVELFSQYDVIVDGTDNFATRYLCNDAAVLAGRPLVWGSIYRFDGQVSVFWEGAPDGRGLNLRDLYPQAPPPGSVPSCAEGGVLGVLCASIGSVMATEAIKLVCGLGESLLGRLMIYDALTMNYRTVRIEKDPAGAQITALIDYDEFCGVVSDDAVLAAEGATWTPAELRDALDEPLPPAVIDVREPVEFEINRIPGAVLIPRDEIVSGRALGDLPHDRRIVLYCKTGIRSAEALASLRRNGFDDAVHLGGGIAAWASALAPDMPVY
ncbi:adenylyltransferase/sulfurtransferase MoeZ [Gordonia sp. HY002]|uniref:adenylyltransferase/sulfurtransferase MoeZ n=1 Tax=Gordonia zhenghanii TaxID=2911516 RepID=UPI001EF136A1|nr:adenylyltransferase/sulfurtransferase MoeZ [Gordonia zhenghanii]MCF8571180.1 adenylyltransferase/sulfurtransferase MoeZ [Gordonia zhenghanii]MCF8606202.1 adenylyltransferase/sulfurtransferase MoeZ [Gordonia zhenghanii]